MLRVLLLAAATATFPAYASQSAEPPEIDAAISTTKAEIAAAGVDASHFSGGLILAQIHLRSVILKNTLAMLEQKRIAITEGITLVYLDAIPRIASPAADASAAAELAKARAEAQTAREEAARYTGGMLQVLALIQEATAKVTAAAVEQRLALQNLGIPLPAPMQASLPMPSKAPGKVTNDKDALR